jgi:hypothetical protein
VLVALDRAQDAVALGDVHEHARVAVLDAVRADLAGQLEGAWNSNAARKSQRTWVAYSANVAFDCILGASNRQRRRARVRR